MRSGFVGWLAIVVASAGCETEADVDVVVAAAVTEPAALAEVDVVDLGGHVGGAAGPIVTVGATGTNGRLTSWKVSLAGIAPAALQDSALISGTNHQLHVLTPKVGPKSRREMLVSASLVAGKLWVRTWSVADDGAFTQLGVLGYGPAGVNVQAYAIGHREIAITPTSRRFQLVTPVVRAGGNLRLVTWEIDGISGAIVARTDSGDMVVGVAADPQVAVAFVPGTPKLRAHYAVSVLSAIGQIENTLWAVDDNGASTLRAAISSGKDIGNAFTVTRNAASLANASLAASGFVTVGDASTHQTGVAGELQVWEDLGVRCGAFTDGCLVPLNIADSSLDTLPAVPEVQQAAVPVLTAPRAVVRDPVYGVELLTKSPNTQQSIASVRKVMVLILALEKVADGTMSLDENITVSDAAAGTAGSNMGLVAGEEITVRDLLYGMMMVSAGDATWALSERIAGTVENMIDLMNAKASDLGLANTVYCHDAGSGFSSVGYSTASDQAALWASVYDDPTFIEIAGRASANICGKTDDAVICHPNPPPMTKPMTQYIELDGWKNGNGGASCAAYLALPGCSDCLTAQTTRLGRPMVSTGLRSSGAGAVWSDATKLFDYAYRQTFTPDFRGDSGAQAVPTTDFGVDAVTDTHAVTATLPGGATLRVCNWSVDIGFGGLTKVTCTDRAIAGLTAGGVPAIPRRVAIVRVSELESEADYVVGRVTAGALKLAAWRVGQKNF